jgi:hypothetical protein
MRWQAAVERRDLRGEADLRGDVVRCFCSVVPIAAGSQFAVTALVDSARRVQPAAAGVAGAARGSVCGSRHGLRLGIWSDDAGAAVRGAVLVRMPEVFAPVSFLAQIMLVLWPFMLLIGPLLLLDVLLPANVAVGSVTAFGARRPGARRSRRDASTCSIGDSALRAARGAVAAAGGRRRGGAAQQRDVRAGARAAATRVSGDGEGRPACAGRPLWPLMSRAIRRAGSGGPDHAGILSRHMLLHSSRLFWLPSSHFSLTASPLGFWTVPSPQKVGLQLKQRSVLDMLPSSQVSTPV